MEGRGREEGGVGEALVMARSSVVSAVSLKYTFLDINGIEFPLNTIQISYITLRRALGWKEAPVISVVLCCECLLLGSLCVCVARNGTEFCLKTLESCLTL